MITKHSMKVWIPAAAVAVALVGGGVAAASNTHPEGAAAKRAGVTTFTVVEHAVSDTVVYVNKVHNDVIGNTLGFGNPLYNAKNSKKIGRDQGFCYRTNPGRSWE